MHLSCVFAPGAEVHAEVPARERRDERAVGRQAQVAGPNEKVSHARVHARAAGLDGGGIATTRGP